MLAKANGSICILYEEKTQLVTRSVYLLLFVCIYTVKYCEKSEIVAYIYSLIGLRL